MALTDYERHLVFEVFDIPDAASVLYIDGAFATGKTSHTGAILVSRTEINALMDGLSEALEQRLRELLEAWKRVSVQGTKIAPNTSNEGVDVAPARDRALIRKRIQKIVPVVTPEDVHGIGGSLPLG